LVDLLTASYSTTPSKDFRSSLTLADKNYVPYGAKDSLGQSTFGFHQIKFIG
jgi:hypothetical protein